MSNDWKLIWRGLGIAVLGAVGVMGYILGLTNLYLGFYALGVSYLAGAIVLIVLFQRMLTPYLDILEAIEDTSHETIRES